MIRWFLLALLVMLAGCDAKHDMGQQPKYDPYEPSGLWADGTSARPAVPGTVARNNGEVPGQPWAWHGPIGETSTVPTTGGAPGRVTRETIESGQTAFNVYCSMCHGRLANGQGMIVQRGLTPPPSFHVQRLLDAPDSHFYEVITYGYGAMYGYADRVGPQQRWEIIAYIRALQAAGRDAPPEQRAALIALGDRSASPAREKGGAP